MYSIRLILNILLAIALLLPARPVPVSATRPAAPATQVIGDLPRALLAPAAEAPASVDHAIALSKVQSAYRGADAVAGRITVTYTLSNLRPPANAPALADGLTVTDTIAALSGLDPLADANTLRSALFTTVLTPGISVVSASRPYSVNGSALQVAWGDVAPLSNVTLTLTLATPTASPDFMSLDGGARAYAVLQGRMVLASAGSIRFAPDALGAYLNWTPDADTRDAWMLRQLSQLGDDPSGLFAFVRALRTESYPGSLRGTRGTLWSQAGNSLDKASLLIALLRASGIPARYRHGSLSPSMAETLLGALFPALPDTTGLVPADADVFDPLHDDVLLAETGDHWWLDAYLPGQGWTAMDPAFASATAGATFHASLAGDGSDLVAEVPDTQRHKVTFRLTVERFGPFSFTSLGMGTIQPLSATIPTVQLVGNPVSLEHWVDTVNQGGLVFATTINTYLPYLVIGDEAIDGQAFQDITSNFPMGYEVSTAEWLSVDLQHPSGARETFTRTIVDLIGVAARSSGGTITNSFGSGTTLVDEGNVYAFLFAPSVVPIDAVNAAYPNLAAAASKAQSLIATADTVTGTSPSEIAQLQRASVAMRSALRAETGAQALWFAAASDFGTPGLAAAAHVAAYYEMPRLIIASIQKDKGDAHSRAVLDLALNRIRSVPYPGQTVEGAIPFNLTWGLMQGELEHALMSAWHGVAPTGVPAVFAQARTEEVPLVLLAHSNVAMLDALELSAQARTRIAQTLAGRPDLMVVVPSRMITVAGTSTVGWYTINMLDGETQDMMEDGLHTAAIEYGFLLKSNLQNFGFAIAGFGHGFFAETMFFLGYFLQECPIRSGNIKNIYAQALTRATQSALDLAKRIGQADKASGGKANDWIDCYLNGCTYAIGFKWSTKFKIPKYLSTGADLATDGKLKEKAGPCSFNLTSLSGDCKYEWHGPLSFKSGISAAAAIIGSHNDPPVPGGLAGQARFTPQPDTSVSRAMTLAATRAGSTLTLTAQVGYASVARGAAAYASATAGLAVSGVPPTFTAFAPGGSAALAGAGLMLGPADAPLYVNGSAVAIPEGVGLPAYTGTLTISETSAILDRISLSGVGHFLVVRATPATASILPGATTAFTLAHETNVTALYTVTAEAPAGWALGLTAAGAVTATAPLAAPPGEYRILVTAGDARSRVFASTWHTVSVGPRNGVDVVVQVDPLHTVAWGSVPNTELTGDTNNGQMQLTDAAFTIVISNTSSVTRSYGLSVAGLPASWSYLSTASVTLTAGAVGRVGLAVSPTLGTLAGSSHPFSVTASATDGALAATGAAVFVMPGRAYAHLDAPAHDRYAVAGSTLAMTAAVRNVGNLAGTFPFTVEAPATWALAAPSSFTLAAGQTDIITFSVVPTGPLYSASAVWMRTRSEPYDQSDYTFVQLVTPYAGAIFATAASCAGAGNTQLASACENLANAVLRLEARPDDVAYRDAVVVALGTVIDLLAAIGQTPALDALDALASSLSGHLGTGLDADLAAIAPALLTACTEADAVTSHAFEATFTPGAALALPGRELSFLFNLHNAGTTSTSYTVVLTSPVIAGPVLLAPTLAAGANASQAVTVSLGTPGFVPIHAHISANTGLTSMPTLDDSAIAGATFVSPILQMLDVVATPAFVDSGVSATGLTARVVNVANSPLQAMATLTVSAPGGGVSATLHASAAIIPGNVTLINFGSLTTSGFLTGVYTLTGSVVVSAPTGLAGATSTATGGFAVGQALFAAAAASPVLVAPGDITVTTLVTTWVHQEAPLPLLKASPAARPAASSTLLPPLTKPLPSPTGESIAAPETALPAMPSAWAEEDGATRAEAWVEADLGGLPSAPTFSGGLTRTDGGNSTVTRTGTWTTVSGSNMAHNGNYSRTSVVSSTLTFTFTGVWLSIGYLAATDGRTFDVEIDGVSQGVIDSYVNRADTPMSAVYAGLSAGEHVVRITTLSGKNAFAATTAYVKIDYFDVWDGSTLADGTFEHTDGRVILGPGWTTQTLATASGGSYARSPFSFGVAWLAFTGDSVSYRMIKDFSNAGAVSVFVDGVLKADLDLYSTLLTGSSVTTPVVSFNGLGAGAHVLTLVLRRGTYLALDHFTTPGSAPFFSVSTPNGVYRVEEGDSSLRYNGFPLTRTRSTWSESASSSASGGFVIASSTAGDSIEMTFSGPWASLGYVATTNSGRVEVFIDGVSRGTVDAYARYEMPRSVVFADLGAGAHTLSVTVLSGRNAFATTPGNFYFDYLDVWDGSALPDGTFEEDSARMLYSRSWTLVNQANAGGGSYAVSPFQSGAAWSVFAGDTVSLQFFAAFANAGSVDVAIDGVTRSTVDLRVALTGTTNLTRVLSLNGLGSGPHVVTLGMARASYLSLDRISTPGDAPFATPPAMTGVYRYEENDPALLYDGAPYTMTRQTWFETTASEASSGYVRYSATASDTISLVFTGTWVSLGYLGRANAGRFEVYVDGTLRQVVDGYAHDDEPRSAVFGGLTPGTHSLSVTVTGARNALATTPGNFYLDYIDVWDGSALPDGSVEENSGRFWYSAGWTRPALAAASNGAYALSPFGGGAAWMAFAGDSVSVQLIGGINGIGILELDVDGVMRTTVDLRVPLTGTTGFTRPISLNGLGSGAHVLTVFARRGAYVNIDAAVTPGVAPFITPFVPLGFTRYEEANPAILYNGLPYSITRQTWTDGNLTMASDGYVRLSATVSDTLSLTFTGTWAALGYIGRSNAGRFEVFLDGVSRGIVDGYAHAEEPRSLTFAGLVTGTHTLSATVLGTRNPLAASPGNFYPDYIDVWDGSALPMATLDESNPLIVYSNGWTRPASALAEGEAYALSTVSGGAVWARFIGDSLRVQALVGTASAGELGVWIDGAFREWVDLDATAPATRSMAYGDLGPGAHVLTLATHRSSYINWDVATVTTPAPYRPLTRTGVYRLEEDDPSLRYNGAPFTATASSWSELLRTVASDRYVARSSTVSDTVSLTFAGPWVAVNFVTRVDGRHAEVFLDGASQGIVDTYTASDDVLSRVYGGLTPTTHTLSITVLSTANVSVTAATKYVYLDAIDVWDGTAEAKGLFQHLPSEQDGGRMYLSDDWTRSARVSASNGDFIEDGSNAWFLFTGVSVTVIGMSDNLTPSLAEIFVDGVSAGVLDLSYAFGRAPMPFTLNGLGDGAHVLRFADRSGASSQLGAGLDGFLTAADVAPLPRVAWTASVPGDLRLATTPLVGDLDGDGQPEVIATGSRESCIFSLCTFTPGALFVFRGDSGALVYSRTLTGTAASCSGGTLCGGTGAPAIVNLDGGPQSEIIVDNAGGLNAFAADGTLLWINPAVRGTWASAPAIGNLDDDEDPEIVTVHDVATSNQRRIHVVQPDGSVSWTYTLPNTSPGPRMPVLADFNGDGRLDIFVASGQTAYLFHNNGVSMTLAYTRASGLDHYGAPAVTDLDGNGLPEIAIGWTGVLAAYRNDLTPMWIYTTGGIYPSTVSVADLDGNDGGAPELVLYSKTSNGTEEGRVFAINADGTLLWSQAAKDTTNSSAGVAVLDLNGDGVYEVVWNGYVSGTLIFDGPSGAITFADEVINSGTVNETPVIADIDMDGHAEVVLVDNTQVVALANDAGWAGSRAIWNQHSYHVTNINDDLTVPPFEPNSWAYHNTYRTQSPLEAPAPVYYVQITHTLATSASLVAGSFTRPYSDFSPLLYWGYKHYWFEPFRVTRFDVAVAGLRPGEVRAISLGTVVSYTVNAGRNRLELPPIYVTAGHLIAVSPTEASVLAGGTTRYDVVLTNADANPRVFTLTIAGLPSTFSHTAPPTLTLAADASITVAVDVSAPAGAVPAELALAFVARTELGAEEAAAATLTVHDGNVMALLPELQNTVVGTSVPFTVIVTNTTANPITYALSLSGLGTNLVTHPPTVSVSAGQSVSVPVTVTAVENSTSLFVRAWLTDALHNAALSDVSILNILGARAVTGAFAPASVRSGQSTLTRTLLTLTNTGTLDDVYTVTLSGPQTGSVRFDADAATTRVIALPVGVLSHASWGVILHADGTLAPGLYPFTATVTTDSGLQPRAVITGLWLIEAGDVAGSLSPATQTAAPGQSVGLTLRITNTGDIAMTYAITGAGVLATSLSFGSASVTLAPGAVALVPVTVTAPLWVVGSGYPLQAHIAAITPPEIPAFATGWLSIAPPAPAMAAVLLPPVRTVTNTTPVTYTFVLTNLAGVSLESTLSITSTADVTLLAPAMYLPGAHAGQVEVVASAPHLGVFPITVTATSSAGSVAATAELRRIGWTFVPNVLR